MSTSQNRLFDPPFWVRAGESKKVDGVVSPKRLGVFFRCLKLRDRDFSKIFWIHVFTLVGRRDFSEKFREICKICKSLMCVPLEKFLSGSKIARIAPSNLIHVAQKFSKNKKTVISCGLPKWHEFEIARITLGQHAKFVVVKIHKSKVFTLFENLATRNVC